MLIAIYNIFNALFPYIFVLALQHAATVLGEKLYVTGGSRNGRYLSDIQVLLTIPCLQLMNFLLGFMFY